MRVQTRTAIAVSWGLVIALSGCASLTGKKRFLVGTGLGVTAGAVGGVVLSPNQESKVLNGLVFGLSGALLGGIAALLTDSKPEVPKAQSNLQELENRETVVQEFQVAPNQVLPTFVRERMQPLVIEEFVEPDSVSEDGILHEPHKAYRVKRPGELFAKPVQSEVHSEVHNAKN